MHNTVVRAEYYLHNRIIAVANKVRYELSFKVTVCAIGKKSKNLFMRKRRAIWTKNCFRNQFWELVCLIYIEPCIAALEAWSRWVWKEAHAWDQGQHTATARATTDIYPSKENFIKQELLLFWRKRPKIAVLAQHYWTTFTLYFYPTVFVSLMSSHPIPDHV